MFVGGAAEHNVLYPPHAEPNVRQTIVTSVPTSERHRHFASMRSSQALAQSVFGSLAALGKAGVLAGLTTDDELPTVRSGVTVQMEYLVEHLAARGESRSYEGSTQSIRRTTLTRMAMGTRETDQPPLWIATSDLPTSPGHPFYARLTTLLDGHHVDRFVEGLCDRFYAPVMGRPSLAPGRYFRLRLVGSFEGIDSERGIAWRATDSLAVRSFLRVAVDEAPPDHSTIARTRRLIDLETHRTVFTWVQQRLVEAGRLTGKTIAIDATTLEATAAMRSIVRRDTGESDQAFLAGLATASGVETPTREGLARLDRKRKKKTSNTDWTHPHDPDATVTKMKDGRTHLAHKAEQAVDMETGAIVAVTRPGADVGDTTTIIETAIAATEQVEDAQANVDDRQSLEEIVGEKGYHSNQTLIDLDAGGIRSYVSEPDRGRRDWSKDPEARAPVYGNRRRMRGRRGRRLMRQRGERIERSFAHLYDTGGMRRTHLRGHTNILKRLLIHAGGFNLGLVMRHLIGIGPPRGLQGRVAAVLATLKRFSDSPCTAWARRGTSACTNAGGPMQAYSMDLRERALLDSDAGMKAADVAVKYRVSGSWVRLLKQRRRETGDVAPRVQRHGRRRMLEPHLHTLAALIAEQPDRTLAELKDALGTPASLATIWRAVAALDVTVKKNGPALRTRST